MAKPWAPNQLMGKEAQVIISMAHATVDDPEAAYIFGAWSNIVVGERPEGLIDCYLSRGDNILQMISIWNTIADHDRALKETKNHPTFGFFEACGLDPSQTIQQVIGRLTGV
jgi:hypothetical protein